MITISMTSKLTKVGNKVRNFSELFNIAPQMVLDAIKADNRLVLDQETHDFLLSQKRFKGICLYIIKISNYRKERAKEMNNQIFITTDENISMGNQTAYHSVYFTGIMYGI